MRRTSSILVAAAVATAIAATAFAQTNPSGSESTPASPAPAASAPASAPAKSTKTTTSTKSTKSTSTSSSTKSSSSHHHTAVDLNTATKEQLMKLPGITDALADRIIAARPYTATKELMSKANLTKAEYDKVHSHVTVAPAKKS